MDPRSAECSDYLYDSICFLLVKVRFPNVLFGSDSIPEEQGDSLAGKERKAWPCPLFDLNPVSNRSVVKVLVWEFADHWMHSILHVQQDGIDACRDEPLEQAPVVKVPAQNLVIADWSQLLLVSNDHEVLGSVNQRNQ
jgi:hypothetical protein